MHFFRRKKALNAGYAFQSVTLQNGVFSTVGVRGKKMHLPPGFPYGFFHTVAQLSV